MANTYLLEVGVEEMPAHVVTPSIKQLHERVAKYLKEQRITFDDIQEFATPRRMALLIHGLSDKQPDIDESVKGPAKKIAQDADGNWTKAAIGFTRGQGASVEDIEFKEVKGVEYVFVEKHIAGKTVAEVLQGLPAVITSMTFPTLMKWGYNNLQFIRPIRWLVSLLNNYPVRPTACFDRQAAVNIFPVQVVELCCGFLQLIAGKLIFLAGSTVLDGDIFNVVHIQIEHAFIKPRKRVVHA